MFTAKDARNISMSYLDERIKDAVINCPKYPNGASMRVYCDDPWLPNLKQELEKRGFINIYIPDIVIKGDVDFYWPEEE